VVKLICVKIISKVEMSTFPKRYDKFPYVDKTDMGGVYNVWYSKHEFSTMTDKKSYDYYKRSRSSMKMVLASDEETTQYKKLALANKIELLC